MNGPDRRITTDDPALLQTMARVEDMHARYDRELDYRLKSRTHLWAVMSMYQLTDAEVRRMVEAERTGVLSAAAAPRSQPDRVLSVTVGCYICEQPLSAQVIDRRCPGEPR